MSNLQDLQNRANQGETNAMVELGVSLLQSGDHKTAMQWWEKAGSLGNKGAMFNLMLMYANRIHPEVKSDTLFIKWLKSLAESGDGVGQIMLGVICSGSKTPHKLWHGVFENSTVFAECKNEAEAFTLIERGISAAGDGLSYDDYFAAAHAYYWRGTDTGTGTFGDLDKAIRYLKKARELAPPELVDITDKSIANMESKMAHFSGN